jgi:hypothetical protein
MFVRADQQLKTVTHGASKGRAIWIDVITNALHIQVRWLEVQDSASKIYLGPSVASSVGAICRENPSRLVCHACCGHLRYMALTILHTLLTYLQRHVRKRLQIT